MNDITSDSSSPATWLILAPFFTTESQWIDDFCNREDIKFVKICPKKPPNSWHMRGATTPFAEWFSLFSYVHRSLKNKSDGIITCFPQLAFITALMLIIQRKKKIPLIAWNFNLGSLSNKWKGFLAGLILQRVDRFIVHSRAEIKSYASWLEIDESRFSFVPLQRGQVPDIAYDSISTPYIVSMGSANRDYKTLIEAVKDLNIPVVIVAKKTLLDNIPDLPQLTKRHGLNEEECLAILKNAKINIVPLLDREVASGQVTFITSMTMGVATIATRCVGTVDYILNGETGFLIAPHDSSALKNTIAKLWNSDLLRTSIATQGKKYAEEHFSDHVAGQNLSSIIDQTLQNKKTKI